MSTEENTRMALRFFEAANQRDMETMLDLTHQNFVEHPSPPDLPAGIEGFRQLRERIFANHPDLQVTVEDLFAAGDKVAVRFTLQATDMLGQKRTREVVAIGQLANGKIAELWEGMVAETVT